MRKAYRDTLFIRQQPARAKSKTLARFQTNVPCAENGKFISGLAIVKPVYFKASEGVKPVSFINPQTVICFKCGVIDYFLKNYPQINEIAKASLKSEKNPEEFAFAEEENNEA